MYEFISVFSIHSMSHLAVFVPIPHCFDDVTSSYCPKSRRIMPPALLFFVGITVGILGLSWFDINFRNICSSSVKILWVICLDHIQICRLLRVVWAF